MFFLQVTGYLLSTRKHPACQLASWEGKTKPARSYHLFSGFTAKDGPWDETEELDINQESAEHVSTRSKYSVCVCINKSVLYDSLVTNLTLSCFCTFSRGWRIWSLIALTVSINAAALLSLVMFQGKRRRTSWIPSMNYWVRFNVLTAQKAQRILL